MRTPLRISSCKSSNSTLAYLAAVRWIFCGSAARSSITMNEVAWSGVPSSQLQVPRNATRVVVNNGQTTNTSFSFFYILFWGHLPEQNVTTGDWRHSTQPRKPQMSPPRSRADPECHTIPPQRKTQREPSPEVLQFRFHLPATVANPFRRGMTVPSRSNRRTTDFQAQPKTEKQTTCWLAAEECRHANCNLHSGREIKCYAWLIWSS